MLVVILLQNEWKMNESERGKKLRLTFCLLMKDFLREKVTLGNEFFIWIWRWKVWTFKLKVQILLVDYLLTLNRLN